MNSIAIISPWPFQVTGIAYYTFDLVQGLKSEIKRIDLYTDCKDPIRLKGIDIKYCDGQVTPDLYKYDLIVYMMGNNTDFHLHMLNLVKQFGGVIHLHDMVLHHLLAWITWMRGDVESYLRLIMKWYGMKARELVESLLKKKVMPWDTEVVMSYPLFEEILQYADACIVHSEYVRKKINKSFPFLRVHTISQVYKGISPTKKIHKKEETINIGVFGGVDPHKRIDIVVHAFHKVLKCRRNCRLHIVGKLNIRCEYLYNLVNSLGIAHRIKIYGMVTDEDFYNLMQNMDIIISLRFPTMGETSAIVMKAIQMGIPTIVNDIGWYSELPVFIDKIPVTNCEDYLYKIMLKYVTDYSYLSKQSEKFFNYASNEINYKQSICDYYKILQKEYKRSLNSKLYENIGKKLEQMQLLYSEDYVLGKHVLNKVISIIK